MLTEPPWWQLGTPLRRPFSWRATVFSYILIFLTMMGVITFTVLSKGYTMLCESRMYKSTDPWMSDPRVFDTCKPTSVYPGQTFSVPGSMFVYEAVALGNMTKAHAVTDCSLVNGSSFSSINFPFSSPDVTFDMNFICNTTGRSSEDQPIAEFAGEQLYPNTIALGIKGPQTRNRNAWRSRLIEIGKRFDRGVTCHGENVMGFTVLGTTRSVTVNYISNNVNGSICTTNGEGISNITTHQRITQFFNRTIEYATEDFKKLTPIPNLIFECPRCIKTMIPPQQMLWNIAVALGSTWSIILLISTGIVARTTNSYDQGYEVWVEAVQMAQSTPNTLASTPSPSVKLQYQTPESESNQYLLSDMTHRDNRA